MLSLELQALGRLRAKRASCARVASPSRSSARARCVIRRSSRGAGSQHADALERGGEVLRREAQAVHAGVDLEPQREAPGARRHCSSSSIWQRIVHHEVEPVVRGVLQLRAAEHPLEQHDARSDAGGAQRHGLLQARHGKGIGTSCDAPAPH